MDPIRFSSDWSTTSGEEEEMAAFANAATMSASEQDIVFTSQASLPRKTSKLGKRRHRLHDVEGSYLQQQRQEEDRKNETGRGASGWGGYNLGKSQLRLGQKIKKLPPPPLLKQQQQQQQQQQQPVSVVPPPKRQKSVSFVQPPTSDDIPAVAEIARTHDQPPLDPPPTLAKRSTGEPKTYGGRRRKSAPSATSVAPAPAAAPTERGDGFGIRDAPSKGGIAERIRQKEEAKRRRKEEEEEEEKKRHEKVKKQEKKTQEKDLRGASRGEDQDSDDNKHDSEEGEENKENRGSNEKGRRKRGYAGNGENEYLVEKKRGKRQKIAKGGTYGGDGDGDGVDGTGNDEVKKKEDKKEAKGAGSKQESSKTSQGKTEKTGKVVKAAKAATKKSESRKEVLVFGGETTAISDGGDVTNPETLVQDKFVPAAESTRCEAGGTTKNKSTAKEPTTAAPAPAPAPTATMATSGEFAATAADQQQAIPTSTASLGETATTSTTTSVVGSSFIPSTSSFSANEQQQQQQQHGSCICNDFRQIIRSELSRAFVEMANRIGR